MLWESVIFAAFIMGIVSAASLPLGTLTTVLWRPGDRAMAFLMAFGGGALLAALTIDLVASTLEKGHIVPLSVGCIAGGLLFVVLNQTINNRGGFLRKSSTLIYYLQRRRRSRLQKILRNMDRIPLFADLPGDEIEFLAQAVVSVEYAPNTRVYEPGDPADHLYIVESGEIDMVDQAGDLAPIRLRKRGEVFGRLAFLSDSPHAFVAIAKVETDVWALPRQAFESLLQRSPDLRDAVTAFLQTEEIHDYLCDRHGLAHAVARTWVERAVKDIAEGDPPDPAVPVAHNTEAFIEISDHIERVPIFFGLPEEEIAEIADKMYSLEFERGDTIFHKGDPANKLYVVELGEVGLIDPQDHGHKHRTVKEHEAFGAMSFLTNARHTVSAVATTDTELWVLRKADFEDLLQRFPHLERRVAGFLQETAFTDYLENRRNFRPEMASRWISKAVNNLDSGRLIPITAEARGELHANTGVPLAIWLGIMLDGIPESLVIGASMIQHSISLSLLAGLFLSNYPEALSSSMGMRQQGFSFRRVLFMWVSLMVMTGIGAALGNMFFVGAQPMMFALVQGVAAGAMLTMIAETMLPEAYFKGGSIVGISTLLGFLVAIFARTLE